MILKYTIYDNTYFFWKIKKTNIDIYIHVHKDTAFGGLGFEKNIVSKMALFYSKSEASNKIYSYFLMQNTLWEKGSESTPDLMREDVKVRWEKKTHTFEYYASFCTEY